MTSTIRRRGPDLVGEAARTTLTVVAPAACWAVLWFLCAARAVVAGVAYPSSIPGRLFVDLCTGAYRCPAWWRLWAPLTAVAIVAAGYSACFRALGRRRQESRRHIDGSARRMSGRADVRRQSRAAAAAQARRLGAPVKPPGVFLGKAVRGGHDVYAPWESTQVDIWGPRTGKTTTRVIPALMAAPGAAVVTSNKLDVWETTRAARARHGPIWLFDPQNMTGQPQGWWWNLLDGVAGDPKAAQQMAAMFSSMVRKPHTRSDGFFEPAAEGLICAFLTAASVGNVPITRIYRWVTRPEDLTPELILRDHGYELLASRVEAMREAPIRQRAGIFGVAQKICAFLTEPSLTRWITPQEGIPEFRLMDFVTEARGTFYFVSQAEDRLAAPIVVAMTACLGVAAEIASKTMPGGRLPVPMLFLLDELANLTPWRLWPAKMTHFGSRGIVVMAFFQSWAQGVLTFGADNMGLLWGSAGVRVYGGGGTDRTLLGNVAQSAGRYDAPVWETKGAVGLLKRFSRTVTVKSRLEDVLHYADLVSLPRGRAVVIGSGSRPVLVRTVPWWEGPYADEIRESLRVATPVPDTAHPSRT